MKRLVVLILIAAAGIVGYNFLFNTTPASAEERALAELERRFEAAGRSSIEAGRAAGTAGLDTTADYEAAIAAARRVKTDLDELMKRLPPGETREKAARLEETIRSFLEGSA